MSQRLDNLKSMVHPIEYEVEDFLSDIDPSEIVPLAKSIIQNAHKITEAILDYVSDPRLAQADQRNKMVESGDLLRSSLVQLIREKKGGVELSLSLEDISNILKDIVTSAQLLEIDCVIEDADIEANPITIETPVKEYKNSSEENSEGSIGKENSVQEEEIRDEEQKVDTPESVIKEEIDHLPSPKLKVEGEKVSKDIKDDVAKAKFVSRSTPDFNIIPEEESESLLDEPKATQSNLSLKLNKLNASGDKPKKRKTSIFETLSPRKLSNAFHRSSSSPRSDQTETKRKLQKSQTEIEPIKEDDKSKSHKNERRVTVTDRPKDPDSNEKKEKVRRVTVTEPPKEQTDKESPDDNDGQSRKRSTSRGSRMIRSMSVEKVVSGLRKSTYPSQQELDQQLELMMKERGFSEQEKNYNRSLPSETKWTKVAEYKDSMKSKTPPKEVIAQLKKKTL